MFISFLVTLIVLLIIAGLLWYAIGLLPIAEPLKSIVKALAILVLVLILLGMLFGAVPVYQVRL